MSYVKYLKEGLTSLYNSLGSTNLLHSSRETILSESERVNVYDASVTQFEKEDINLKVVKDGIKKFNVNTENIDGDIYLFLYHGTSKANHTKILKSGKLKVNTYLSHDPEIAKRYSRLTGSNQPTFMLVCINSNGLTFSGEYFYTIRDMYLKGGLYN